MQQPKISTGAGDHFNAGFCLGRVLGFWLAESLCAGVATSGYYVRTGEPDGGAARRVHRRAAAASTLTSLEARGLHSSGRASVHVRRPPTGTGQVPLHDSCGV